MELKQSRRALEDLLLHSLAGGLEEVHGAVHVLQRELWQEVGQTHVFGQPLEPAVALGGGGEQT